MVNEETALVPVEHGALISAAESQAALMALMTEDAGVGLEDVTAADIAIPFMKLLQKGSPECEEGNQAFIADAVPGMLLNNVTREVVDIRSSKGKWALFVPVNYQKVIAEWRPNQQGKVTDHPMNQAILDGATRKETPDGGIVLVNDSGNTLEETAKFHGLLADELGGMQWGILALTGSKLGAARKWMHLVTSKKLPNGAQAPIYSHSYKVSSFLDTSKRTAKTYQQLRFEDGGRITDVTTYQAAKLYRDAVLAGKVKESPDGPVQPQADDDVPF